MSDNNYNPDVLSCIANLSSDEVFTPPQLANRILDGLPTGLWSDKKSTFLDPGCKSGVFLREIVKRLDKGLEKYIANRQKRLDHIFKNQVFGLAITELTALISRRSVYCSKTANGKYSVCEAFDNSQGNIRFGRVEHTWGKWPLQVLRSQRGELRKGRRTRNPRLCFYSHQQAGGDLQYEIRRYHWQSRRINLGDGGGDSQRQAQCRSTTCLNRQESRTRDSVDHGLRRRVGSRVDGTWMSSESQMLADDRLRSIDDFPDATDVFPGLDITQGGVSLLPLGSLA